MGQQFDLFNGVNLIISDIETNIYCGSFLAERILADFHFQKLAFKLAVLEQRQFKQSLSAIHINLEKSRYFVDIIHQFLLRKRVFHQKVEEVLVGRNLNGLFEHSS